MLARQSKLRAIHSAVRWPDSSQEYMAVTVDQDGQAAAH
jgi:hypothetical protein